MSLKSFSGVEDFFIPSEVDWRRMVVEDDLLCGKTEAEIPKGLSQTILQEILMDTYHLLNTTALVKYMKQRSLLTRGEVWELTEKPLSPDDKNLCLQQILLKKGESGIIELYLCLLESYGQPGLKGHYTLSQVIRSKVRHHCKLPHERFPQDAASMVQRVKPIAIALEAIDGLSSRLSIPPDALKSDNPTTLDVAQCWLSLAENKDWTVLVEVFLSEPGLGCAVSGMLPPCSSNPPEVWDYIRHLGSNWWCFAQYLGFPQALISSITNTWSRNLPAQQQAFTRACLIPDCGDRRMKAIVEMVKAAVRLPTVPTLFDAADCGHAYLEEGEMAMDTELKLKEKDPALRRALILSTAIHLLQHVAINELLWIKDFSSRHSSGATPGPAAPTTLEETLSYDFPEKSLPQRNTHEKEMGPEAELGPQPPPQEKKRTNLKALRASQATDRRLQETDAAPHGEPPLPASKPTKDDKGEELLQYCAEGDWDIAKLLVTTGSNLEAINKNGATALHLSCTKGNMDMTDVLLQHGASVRVKDNVGNTCLHYKEALRNPKLVQRLTVVFHQKEISVDQSNKNGQTPLMIACQSGDMCYESAMLLITHGANPNGLPGGHSTPLIYASMGGNMKIVKLLLTYAADVDGQDKERSTALIQACLCSHEEIARELLHKGAEVSKADKSETTALAAAVTKNSYALVQMLIERGADVNVSRSITSSFTPGQVEETPLASACARGFQDIAELLVQHGAKVDFMCSDQVPPVGFAIICRQQHIVQFMLGLPNFSKTAYALRVPMQIAMRVENYEAAGMLLNALGGPKKALEEARQRQLMQFHEEIQIYMAMVPNHEELHMGAPALTTAGVSRVLADHRSRTEEILQKFSQIFMSAVTRSRECEELVGVATGLNEPNIAMFFREYYDKPMRPDILKSRFLSRDQGLSPAAYLIENRYLDAVQFQCHVFEFYPEGPDQFYADLVWVFHQIPGGEDLPWEVESVLTRLFSGGFTLGVQTVSRGSLPREFDTMSTSSLQRNQPSSYAGGAAEWGCSLPRVSSFTSAALQPTSATGIGIALPKQNGGSVGGSSLPTTTTPVLSQPDATVDGQQSRNAARTSLTSSSNTPPKAELSRSPTLATRKPSSTEVDSITRQSHHLMKSLMSSPKPVGECPSNSIPTAPQSGSRSNAFTSPEVPVPQRGSQTPNVTPQTRRQRGASEPMPIDDRQRQRFMSEPMQTETHVRSLQFHQKKQEAITSKQTQSLSASPQSRSESTQSRRPSKIPIHVNRRQMSVPGTSTDKQTTQRAVAHSDKGHPGRIKRQLSFSEEASYIPELAQTPSRSRIAKSPRKPPSAAERPILWARQQSVPLKAGLNNDQATSPPVFKRSVSSAHRTRSVCNKQHLIFYVNGIPMPNRKIQDRESKFRQLSSRMLKWRFVGRYLFLKDEDLSAIKQNPKYSRTEQCYQMLNYWYETNPERATYARLAQALVDTRQESLLEDFREMISDDQL